MENNKSFRSLRLVLTTSSSFCFFFLLDNNTLYLYHHLYKMCVSAYGIIRWLLIQLRFLNQQQQWKLNTKQQKKSNIHRMHEDENFKRHWNGNNQIYMNILTNNGRQNYLILPVKSFVSATVCMRVCICQILFGEQAIAEKKLNNFNSNKCSLCSFGRGTLENSSDQKSQTAAAILCFFLFFLLLN